MKTVPVGSIMYYDHSCRACGTYMMPISLCIICKEYISWACPKCFKRDDVTHKHDYCRISYIIPATVEEPR